MQERLLLLRDKKEQHSRQIQALLDEIYYCCDWGYGAGFRTFVLQGGEDSFSETTFLWDNKQDQGKIQRLRDHPLLGERGASYQRLFDAGADRYLLRHETANETHYCKLHPSFLTLANRKSASMTSKR